MSSLPATAPVVEVEPAVLPHVRVRGVEHVFRHVLESVPRLFPTFRSLHVSIRPDVADDDLIFIVFEARVPLADLPDYVGAKRLWGDDFLASYPPPRLEHFVLHLKREEE